MSDERGRLKKLPGGATLRRLVGKGMLTLATSGEVAVGRNVRVGSGTVIRSLHGLSIEDGVAIGRNCTIEVAGRIGYKTVIAANVGIVGRNDHALDELGTAIVDATWVGDREKTSSDEVNIGVDVWIGYGAVLLSGIAVGDGAVIAAGSVVTRDVGSFEIVGGNPAQTIGHRMSDTIQAEHLRLLNSTRNKLGTEGTTGSA
ncbi:acetyltransferase [Nesterenkonia sp. LB17]|uniref:DapH/DapD/GlmU-related protein n=1 Tax=Nesterenkonia sp. LB17 TaxID=2901230 RepID=UPI001F4CC2FE|nr:DapH/DapD/GlmU-related protein [Nesterenkonia sp. LB17]MCH8564898.1 acetyltransferase [Nesterenkonia sp. LB17]